MVSVGEARSLWRHRSSRTLLRQTRLVIALDDALRRRVCVANPLESVCVSTPLLYLTNTQLLSMDILA